jgi:hypothetical protein
MDVRRFPEILRAIYALTSELEAMFPGRHFTPDGHMVGSIGEALGMYHYGISLYSASNADHDGECEGKKIQIKATQRKAIAISSCPEYLLVLRIYEDGSFTEEYNGPGEPVWKLVEGRKTAKRGQYQISLKALHALPKTEPAVARISPTRA